MTLELRPYQLGAIDDAREAFRHGARRLLMVAPTGSGKTVIASAIIHAAEKAGSRVAFLAHRRELITQTSDKLHRFGVRHGIIQAGTPMRLGEKVQVGSVQTLVRRLDVLEQVELVIVDEAHHATAGAYQALLNFWGRARVMGLTATPWRLDGKGLGDLFDSHVIATTPGELFDQGYLAPVLYRTFHPIDTRGVAVTAGDFNVGALAGRALEKVVVGDVVSQYREGCAGKRAVLFACTVAHSKAMAQAFVDAGVPAEHVDGEMPGPERDAVLARLRAGATLVLCNVNICTEGWDLPELEVCILCRPTLSESLYLQMVGRVLRPHPGKTVARVHDHARLAIYGHPYDEREFKPERTARVKRAAVEARRVVEGAEVVRRAPGLVLEAQAQEVHRGAGRQPQPPKPFFLRLDELGKRLFFLKMVGKHGPRKAKAIYRWASGEREWPRREWERQLGA